MKTGGFLLSRKGSWGYFLDDNEDDDNDDLFSACNGLMKYYYLLMFFVKVQFSVIDIFLHPVTVPAPYLLTYLLTY
jgi:hypothetical protein